MKLKQFAELYRVKADGFDEELAFKFDPWRFSIAAELVIAAILFAWHARCGGTVGKWVALYGGLLAIVGVFVSLRPMIRMGGYRNWRRYQTKPEPVTAGYEWVDNDIWDPKQTELDDLAQLILGPALVGVGTFINAASGFVF